MGLLTSVVDNTILLYFISHIPISIFFDSQSVIPARFFPGWALDTVRWHIKTNEDHLVQNNPLWFVSLVACETFLQLPFFFVAIYAFIKRRNWIRIPSIVYGTHVVTTMVPILTDILIGPDSGPKRMIVFYIYLPYLVVPLLLLVRMLASPEPFGAGSVKAGKRKTR